MSSERGFLTEYFAGRGVARRRERAGDEYVAMVDGRWDLTYAVDPHDEGRPAALEMDLGLLPFDEGRRIRSLRALLAWNHSCLRRLGYGAVLREGGQRAVLRRLVAAGEIEDRDARRSLARFIDAGRRLHGVLQGANEAPPAGVRYM